MSRKVLLINPMFTEGITVFNIPMGLLYLGSWLLKNGYEVCILDVLHYKDMESFFKKVDSELPDALCVGISVMSTQIPNALQISKFIRGRRDSTPIIWGGVHPTLYPEQTARCEYVDYIVKGEGEITLLELIHAIEKGNQPSNVNGLAFRSGEGVVETFVREPLDINELPPIEWGLVKNISPNNSLCLKEMSKAIVEGLPIITSRGCPHRCTFCINSILKTKYRYRRTDLLLDEIKGMIDLGVERIHFADENFFAHRERVREIIDGIEKQELKFKWSASVRTDYFHDDYLGSAKFLSRVEKCGCYLMGTGAESGSQRILDMIKKDTVVEDTLNMARHLDKVGIIGTFAFMIGLPNEEESDYKQTLKLIDEVVKVNQSFYITGLQIYRPYPGSQLYRECLKYGLEQPNTVEEWASSPFIHTELSRRSYYDKSFHSWINYSGDLTNLVFYADLMGMCPRGKLITKIARFIGCLRCRKYYFKYPLLKKLYGWLRGTSLEEFLRRKGLT